MERMYECNTKEHPFPSTRYQGSKSKLIDWIHSKTAGLSFDTVLDAFGGTGSVSHMFKRMGKAVTYNDVLASNSIMGKALIENDGIQLDDADLEKLFETGDDHPSYIRDTFRDIYYTDEENGWLDGFTDNLRRVENEYARAIGYYALFQACISKRPYNLFHRANLYVRTSDVSRSFGNKTTWDKPFPALVKKFAAECNSAVFDNQRDCVSINKDVFSVEGEYDLVYIDTPYIGETGVSSDYMDYYHFLEGLADYDIWNTRIDTKYKHKPIRENKCRDWTDKKTIASNYGKLFEKFSDSILVISYRSDGIPSIDEICDMVRNYKDSVTVHYDDYQYALSSKKTKETLIIGS